MKINAESQLRAMQTALGKLEKQAGADGVVKPADIKQKGLKELARSVQTGCTSTVSVKDIKRALASVGADVKRADADRDGKLDAKEQKKLSPLAARLLNATVTEPSGGHVSTGCGSSSTTTPSRPTTGHVSTGCGSSSTTTPSRPSTGHVSTGCGSSSTTTPTPAPARPSTPHVSTGCGSSTGGRVRTGC